MRPALLLLLLAGCSENALHGFGDRFPPPYPVIDVTPAQLDFETLDAGSSAVLPFTVRNVGGAELIVHELAIEAGSFTLLSDPTPFSLAPEQAIELDVVFSPLEPDLVLGEVEVGSNDEERPVVPVALTGRANIPRLRIEPERWDFGARPFGCDEDVTLVLQNVGDMDLVIGEAIYAGEQLAVVGAEALSGLVLAPREWTTASVRYTPFREGPVSGALSVRSNDPNGLVVAEQVGVTEPGLLYEDRFTTEPDPPVDVLFAIDQSCSMDDDAERLSASFDAFVAEIGTVTSGWHVGVVTLDDGCFNGGVLSEATADLDRVFAEAATLGSDLEIQNDEALLRLVDTALRNTAAGACNEGFLRDGALLHVVVLSDEPERSTEQAAAWTWDYWVDRYLGYVAADPLVVVSGVVDAEGCNEGDAGYAEAIAATGGEHLSICSTDWPSAVASLAAVTTSYAYTFPLSEPAVAETVQVSVDGASWTEGWRYDEGLNAVVFPSLTAGSSVHVRYGGRSECPEEG